MEWKIEGLIIDKNIDLWCIRRGPDQDVHFALILWYVASISPNFEELILYSSRIS